MTRRISGIRLFCGPLLAGMLLLCGCGGVPVKQEVTRQQADEVVAALSAAGIGAEIARESGGRGKYSVVVARDAYAGALALLQEKKLPREPRLSFAELIAQQGLIPNSREIEALRVDHAKAAELEELLTGMAGVRMARAVVRQSSAPSAPEAGVSVVLQADSAPLDREQVTNVIQRAVPGVPLQNIALTVDRPAAGLGKEEAAASGAALTPFLKLWRVPQADYRGLASAVIACLAAAAIVGLLLGYGLAYSRPGIRGGEISQRRLKSQRLERSRHEGGND